jgi:hypothetical protein
LMGGVPEPWAVESVAVAVLTDAVIQHRHRRIADPDQAWILVELIAGEACHLVVRHYPCRRQAVEAI